MWHRFMIGKALALLLFCAASASAAVQRDEDSEPPRRQVQYHEQHTIEMDGSTVSTYRLASKVLAQSAVEDAKQASLSVSRSAQQLQVLEAYTLKPGGRRLNVPRSSWQVRKSTGRAGQSPIFSDHDSTSLVYPDVAVGDTVVLVYRIATRVPLFPGKVSLTNSFSRAYPYDDVKVVIDAPLAMPLKTQVFDLAEAQTVERGRRVTTWTWRNPVPVPETRRDWSVYEVGTTPGYLVSSFESWDDVARSYTQRARPKAAVTPAVRELSDKLSAGKSDVQDKARAIHGWVATQVGYAGNCVGIGAVVPRDLSVVLQHRLGDCKDHATLLQALLAAQGIDSHQVLVNAGNLYELPEVPVVSMVNHVLNYIPALGLFTDSTDPSSSFGRLPYLLYGKPVLSDDASVPRRIPAAPGGNTQTMKTVLAIEEDGSVRGSVDVALAGMFALNSRARFRDMQAQQRKDFVRDSYRRSNLQAEGTLELDDPVPLTDTFHLAGTFRVAKAIGFPGNGGLGIAPWFYNEAPVFSWAQQAGVPVEDVNSVCGAGSSVEEYDVTLPEAMRVVAIPDAMSVDTPFLRYESSYTLEGRRFTARRVLEDRSPTGVCSAGVLREFREASQVVLKDVRQQLLYR